MPGPADRQPANTDAPATPCIGVCAVTDYGVCSGCLRTIDEITRWGAMDDEERRRVMAQLETRPRVL